MFLNEPLQIGSGSAQVVDFIGVVPLFRLGRFQSDVRPKNCADALKACAVPFTPLNGTRGTVEQRYAAKDLARSEAFHHVPLSRFGQTRQNPKCPVCSAEGAR